MERQPAVRVSAARDMLGFLEQIEPGTRERVWNRVPEASREFIAPLGRMSWIPLEHDHWLPDSIEAELGRERSAECFRQCIPHMVQKPLLEPLVGGMLRILGRRRTRLISVIPKGWGLVFRDFCEPRCETREDDEVVVVFDDIAPAVRRLPVYFRMWEGVCLGMLDFTRRDGTLDFEIAADLSSIRARFSWDI